MESGALLNDWEAIGDKEKENINPSLGLQNKGCKTTV
jgi:hypothetical protein